MEQKEEKAQKPTDIGIICASCGKPIEKSQAKGANTDLHKIGYLPYCVQCQQDRMSMWRRATGDKRTLALFMACMMFDVPYIPEIVSVTSATKNGLWITYLANVRKYKKNKVGDRFAGFQDGVTEMAAALGEDMPTAPADGDFGLTQREQWNRKWGHDQSDEACQQMDNLYDVISAEYKGAISPRMDLAIRDICKLRILRDKSLKTDSSEAKRYQEMIDKIMTSEAMKVGDAKPTEAIRVDALADALEKRGVLVNGKFNMRGVLNYIAQDKGTYLETLDIVDSIMLKMVNAQRTNLGEAEMTKLPKDLRVHDVFDELSKVPSSTQASVMKKMDVVPQRKKGSR